MRRIVDLRLSLVASLMLVLGAVNVASANDGSDPHAMFDAGGTLLFAANDGVHGVALWRSDGTAAGTWMVKDLVTGTYDSADPGIVGWARLAGRTFFVADRATWMSDGTPAGTRRVKDRHGRVLRGVAPSSDGPLAPGVARMDGAVYVNAQSNGDILARTDGTRAGTVAVTPIDGSLMYRFRVVRHRLFFVNQRWRDDGIELWITDGTRKGTRRVKDIRPGRASGDPRELTAAGGRLFFTADDGIRGRELWTSDGTEAGTRLVRDVVPGPEASEPRDLVAMGGILYFSATDRTGEQGLWRSDGTREGTRRVTDFVPDNPDSVGVITRSGSRLLFGAADGLWKSDGSIGSGTFVAAIQAQRIVPVGGAAFVVSGVEGSRGNRLYRTDGTEQGTTKVTLEGLTGNYEIGAMAAVGGSLFFSAGETMSYAELWVVPKGKSVAHLVADINQQP